MLSDELLQKTGIIPKIGLSQIENKISAKITAHDIAGGCTLAETTYGVELVLPLCNDFPVDFWITVAISSNEIALSLHHLFGISIQNQISGRICALIPSERGFLVQIDCGNVWVAGISLKACRDMNLQEGDNVYCLAKTQAFSYLL